MVSQNRGLPTIERAHQHTRMFGRLACSAGFAPAAHRQGMPMTDTAESMVDATPQRLARLFSVDADPVGAWGAHELGAILRHQLASPVDAELSPPAVAHGGEIRTYADLLRHPHPPVELLRLLKNFAKCHCGHPLSALPAEVMAVLYYASIVAARFHAHARITRLTDSELQRGIDWIISQPWLEDTTRCLLDKALQNLKTES